MINSIIEFSGRNKFVVFVLIAAAFAGGLLSMKSVGLDAIPDLSDTQVIVYSRWDRSPDIMEDQVTYPISSAMLSVPGVRTVRGFSDFGYSYVYIIFEEGTDIYWARSRTLEYLSAVQPRLPQGVRTEMGPDATGIGWVFQYVLKDTSGKHDLAELRSMQDWFLRYQLQAVPGVAEVAPLGGFVRQYQVNVDPVKLQAYRIPISRVVEAVRAGNNDVGGRLVEMSGTEYMVRGRGYPIFRTRLDARFVAALADDQFTAEWQVPVKLAHGRSGSNGVVLVGADRVVYKSTQPGESRTWRISDLDNVSSSDAFDMTLTTHEATFRFQLKQALSEPRLQALWLRVNQTRGLQILSVGKP